MQREEKIQRTKNYLLDFEKVGFPYEESVMATERSIDSSRDYLNYSLGNGSTQEELTTLLIFHYLTWDDNAWALDFLAMNGERIKAKPKIKKSLAKFL